MIQRKQTLYLLCSFLIIGSLLFLNLGNFAGEEGIFELRFNGLLDVTRPDSPSLAVSIPALAITIILPLVLCLLSIFMYKKRPLQMRVTGINIGLQVGLSAFLVFSNYILASKLGFEWHFYYTSFLPLMSAVFSYLAYRGISDDEALINSLNRLR